MDAIGLFAEGGSVSLPDDLGNIAEHFPVVLHRVKFLDFPVHTVRVQGLIPDISPVSFLHGLNKLLILSLVLLKGFQPSHTAPKTDFGLLVVDHVLQVFKGRVVAHISRDAVLLQVEAESGCGFLHHDVLGAEFGDLILENFDMGLLRVDHLTGCGKFILDGTIGRCLGSFTVLNHGVQMIFRAVSADCTHRPAERCTLRYILMADDFRLNVCKTARVMTSIFA